MVTQMVFTEAADVDIPSHPHQTKTFKFPNERLVNNLCTVAFNLHGFLNGLFYMKSQDTACLSCALLTFFCLCCVLGRRPQMYFNTVKLKLEFVVFPL